MQQFVEFYNDDFRINTAEDWGSILQDVKHSPAVQKKEHIDIPAGNGTIDTSTVLTNGVPVFEDRTLTYTFFVPVNITENDDFETEIRNQLDGKTVNIIESRNQAYYWIGRCEIGEFVVHGKGVNFNITCTVKPLKYGIASEMYGTAYLSNESHVFNIAKSGYNSTNLTLFLGGGTTSIISVSVEYKGVTYDIDNLNGKTQIALDQFIFECDGTNNTEPVTVTISGYCYATGIMIRRGYL